jgi:hypothetical protein
MLLGLGGVGTTFARSEACEDDARRGAPPEGALVTAVSSRLTIWSIDGSALAGASLGPVAGAGVPPDGFALEASLGDPAAAGSARTAKGGAVGIR